MHQQNEMVKTVQLILPLVISNVTREKTKRPFYRLQAGTWPFIICQGTSIKVFLIRLDERIEPRFTDYDVNALTARNQRQCGLITI